MSLTRRCLLCAAAIIMIAIAGLWSGPPLAGFWRWPAALLMLTIVWERWQLNRNFEIRREISPNIALGKPAQCLLHVHNRHQYQSLLIETQADYERDWLALRPVLQWRLQAGASAVQEMMVTPLSLGSKPLGKLYLRRRGHLGLLWWPFCIDDQLMVNVEPQSLADDQKIPGSAGSGQRDAYAKPGSGLELLAIREYQHGDNLRSVDWKATAKRGKTMVRLFNQEQQLEIAILLDCGRVSRVECGQLDRLHHYINVAARLSEFAVQHDDKVACMAYAEKIQAVAPMGNGLLNVRQIRALLSQIAVSQSDANPLLAALELQRLLRHRGLVIFLTGIEQPSAATHLLQAVQLLAVKHHVLVADIVNPQIEQQTMQVAENWLDPYKTFAAREYTKERNLTRKKLLRAGVDVVQAPADLIDKKILQYYTALRQQTTV